MVMYLELSGQTLQDFETHASSGAKMNVLIWKSNAIDLQIGERTDPMFRFKKRGRLSVA